MGIRVNRTCCISTWMVGSPMDMKNNLSSMRKTKSQLYWIPFACRNPRLFSLRTSHRPAKVKASMCILLRLWSTKNPACRCPRRNYSRNIPFFADSLTLKDPGKSICKSKTSMDRCRCRSYSYRAMFPMDSETPLWSNPTVDLSGSWCSLESQS